MSFLTELNWELSEDDPGIFISFNNDIAVHNVMTIPGLVMPTGLNAGVNSAASGANVRGW